MKINVKKLFRIIIPIVWLILFGRLLSRDYFIEKLDIREKQAIQRGLEESYMGIYFKNERVKIEFSLARGKKKWDKRQTIMKKDLERQSQRLYKGKRIKL